MMIKKMNEFKTVIIKNVLFIIIMMILGAVAFGLYAKHKQKTIYTSDVGVVVGRVSSERVHRNTSVLADINMMPTYRDMANDNRITERTYKYLPKKVRKKLTITELSDVINFETHPDSLILHIKATTDSKNNSVNIVNATAKAIKYEFPKVDPEIGTVKVLSKAKSQNTISKTKPSIKKYAILGMALGLLLGMIISFFITSWTKFI